MWLGLDVSLWTSCHWGVAVCGWDWTYGLAAIGGVAVCGWDWTYGLAAIGGLLYVVGTGRVSMD